MSQPPPVRASLFITCIIDQLYPEVGVSVVRALRRCGVAVDFPADQTCCGQPLYNSGFTDQARRLAARTLRALAGDNYVIVPSGSCGAMMRVFYHDLFADDPEMLAQAANLSRRLYEFTEFLAEAPGVSTAEFLAKAPGVSTAEFLAESPGVNPMDTLDAGPPPPPRSVAYHPSCHLLREMQVQDAPLRLLSAAPGLTPVALPDAAQCCGFGGTFAVKYPHISAAMLDDKIASILASRADTLTACDMGCLMHIGGAVSRRRLPVRVQHIAQLLDPEAANYG